MGRRIHYYQHLQAQLGDTSHLTERRATILHLAANGFTNQEIADKLGIGVETVISHLDALRDQFFAMNRVDLVAQAFIHGVLKARHLAVVVLIGASYLQFGVSSTPLFKRGGAQ